jgi:hypothetical protein
MAGTSCAVHHRGDDAGNGLGCRVRAAVEVKAKPSSIVPDSQPALLVRRTITFVVFVIAGLSFAFGFGNGYLLGLQLGVSSWIAPLVAPAVDLSVIGLLTSLHFIRSQGSTDRLVGPRVLLVFCGLVTFALNTARPILAHAVGRACFDAVAPCLLIGWSEVGPRLLTLLHGSVPGQQDEPRTVPDENGPSDELLALARKLDAEHRETVGRPITRDKLRVQLKVSNALAGELVRRIRAEPLVGDSR